MVRVPGIPVLVWGLLPGGLDVAAVCTGQGCGAMGHSLASRGKHLASSCMCMCVGQ